MALSLTNQLSEAQAAYHDLMIGKTVVQFRDSNGEFVSYLKADASKLLQYIEDLKAQIAALTGCRATSRAPLRIFL
ncbi:gpW family head-tail joining protein [Sphingomonas sp. RB3P16]|uniref:gpW family head-tail joining protein n=1 Tax=Parasphingomonas frigoris TaxID=3096163 RepID=UPI002FC916FF